MTRKEKVLAIAGAAVSLAVLATGAMAQTTAPDAANRSGQPAAGRFETRTEGLSESEVRNRLQAQGYAEISELKRLDGGWQVTAKQGGKVVVLDVDPNTGEARTAAGPPAEGSGSSAATAGADGEKRLKTE